MTPAPTAGVANRSFGTVGRPWLERLTFGCDGAEPGMDNASRGLRAPPLLFREVIGGRIGADIKVGAGAVDMLKIYCLPICN